MLTLNWTERPSAFQILNSKFFQNNNTILKKISIPIYSKTKTSAMNASKMNIDILSYLMSVATIDDLSKHQRPKSLLPVKDGDKKPIKVFAKKPN